MSNKFTPGPWTVEHNPMGADIIIAEDCKICEMPNWDAEYEQEETANAHLMAAAPDLLAALQYAIRQVPELANVPGIRAAIDKATGGAV